MGPWREGAAARLTWAELRALNAASYNPGQLFYVSDVGVGGSYWYSNGTIWRPVNGSVVLANDELGAISTTQTTYGVVAGWELLVPAGLMERTGAKLRTMLRSERLGTLAGTGTCQATVMTRTSSIMAAHSFVSNSATADTMQALGVLSRISPTLLRHSANYGLAWTGSSNSAYNETVVNTSTDLTLELRGNATAAGETLTFRDVLVECMP